MSTSGSTYTAKFLLGIANSAHIPNDLGEVAYDDIKQFTVGAGWIVTVFYDGAELAYIDHFTSPAGEVIDFWKWPDSEDRDKLINWRG